MDRKFVLIDQIIINNFLHYPHVRSLTPSSTRLGFDSGIIAFISWLVLLGTYINIVLHYPSFILLIWVRPPIRSELGGVWHNHFSNLRTLTFSCQTVFCRAKNKFDKNRRTGNGNLICFAAKTLVNEDYLHSILHCQTRATISSAVGYPF